MACTNKTDLINDVYKLLALETDDNSISMVLKQVGQSCQLDGAALLLVGESPLLYEVSDIWELEPSNMRGKILDYREATQAQDVFTLFGVKSAVIESVTRDSDFLGQVVFYKKDEYSWSEEEEELFKNIADCLYSSVLRRNRYNVQYYLVEESYKLVQGAAQSKKQFISNVSHDIRTPINALTGIISIMRHNMENQEILNQCLERMEKTSSMLVDIVGSCVEKSVLENESALLNKSWFNLKELVDMIDAIIRPLAVFKKHELIFNYDPKVSINADFARLVKVLSSLLDNACKFTPVGGRVSLDISIDSINASSKLFQFRIADNGMGMKESIVKHFFDSMLDDKTNYSDIRNMDVGIGLMVIRHLVDVMHGSLDISSKEGIGTEIVISMELESDATVNKDIVIHSDDSQREEMSEMYMGRRILIAEDNVLMAEILSTVLGFSGLETDIAVNGKEALEAFTSHDAFYYDMIFMDISMPVMDGLEAAKAIRDSGTPDSSIVPIIALSSNTFAEDETKSLEAGMNAHLGKPVGEKELFETIERFMM